jgi:hypothetical protein
MLVKGTYPYSQTWNKIWVYGSDKHSWPSLWSIKLHKNYKFYKILRTKVIVTNLGKKLSSVMLVKGTYPYSQTLF